MSSKMPTGDKKKTQIDITKDFFADCESTYKPPVEEKDKKKYDVEEKYGEDDEETLEREFLVKYYEKNGWLGRGISDEVDDLYDETYHPKGKSNLFSPDAWAEVCDGLCEPESWGYDYDSPEDSR